MGSENEQAACVRGLRRSPRLDPGEDAGTGWGAAVLSGLGSGAQAHLAGEGDRHVQGLLREDDPLGQRGHEAELEDGAASDATARVAHDDSVGLPERVHVHVLVPPRVAFVLQQVLVVEEDEVGALGFRLDPGAAGLRTWVPVSRSWVMVPSMSPGTAGSCRRRLPSGTPC